ncbi:prepilin-type N-terminal cleavage/methylation domain-containing protein [Demequina sp.]|uniref:prepilin-type N-terminal cleavage/methylation domain-containing protein n=1 Tax=Demequina sp. TaxID=2050685 RepID=UPI003A875CFE
MARRASRTSFTTDHSSFGAPISAEPLATRTARAGFTIVELLIVVVVIAILAAITIVAYNGISNRAKSSASLSGVEQAGKKVATYAIANGNALPADLAAFRTATGLNDNGNTTYQYTRNAAVTPNTYCVTYTTGSTSAQIAGDDQGGVFQPTEGPCTGHTGTSPTTLADGSSCPTGYIVVPGSSLYGTRAFCVMKYEAKNDGSGNAVSTANGTPWVSITQTSAISTAAAACDGCHLISEAEWLTIAQNVMSVGVNWSGGSVGLGSMVRGHTDSSPASALDATCSGGCDGLEGTGQTTGEQRRIFRLTNDEVIWDLAGNVWEWTSGTTEGGRQPGASGYAWRQWNALSMPGNLTPSPYPAYANTPAAVWDSGQNIGQVYSDSPRIAVRAFRHGGYWGGGSQAGIYALALDLSNSEAGPSIGFRVAR